MAAHPRRAAGGGPRGAQRYQHQGLIASSGLCPLLMFPLVAIDIDFAFAFAFLWSLLPSIAFAWLA